MSFDIIDKYLDLMRDHMHQSEINRENANPKCPKCRAKMSLARIVRKATTTNAHMSARRRVFGGPLVMSFDVRL